jgi:putative membrane protein
MDVTRIWKSGILLVLSGFLSYLAVSKQLAQYIAPKQYIFVGIGALFMFVLAALQLYWVLQRKPISHCDDCAHDLPTSNWKRYSIFALFLLPVALGVFTSNAINASDLAKVKGVQFTNNGIQVDSKSQAKWAKTGDLNTMFKPIGFASDYANLGKKLYQMDVIPVHERGFSEVLSTLNAYKIYFEGKRLEIGGFVTRERGLGNNRFILSRFLLSCCSADALPYGIIIESEDASSYKNNSWWTITGTIKLIEYEGQQQLALVPDHIVPLKKPASPYIPRFDGKLTDLP